MDKLLFMFRTPMIEPRDPREFVYRIDGAGRIRFVDDAWLAFAAENGWQTSAAEVLGSPLMSHISDAETRHIYRLLFERVRSQGREVRFDYRCDSADCRRFMEMRIRRDPSRDLVELRSRVVRLERRDPVPLLAPRFRGPGLLTVCSWCKSVDAKGVWLEVEEAVERLGLFAPEALPRISHGICPACSERMSGREIHA
jgi:hypothetical protein